MVKTITLTAGTPQAVKFSEAYPFYWIDNKTSSDVYASVGGNPEPDTDGTYTIPAGSQLRISGGDFNSCLTLLGEGKVQVVASGIASCPFKSAPVGGGGEGGDADTVNGHTVEADVPADAVFTDTVYDDTDIREDISNCVKTDDSRLSNARTPTAHTHDERYYTEAEIDAMLDEKAGKDAATQSADGLMSADDKVKLDEADNTYASKALYDDTTINVGRKADTTVGSRSTAEGYSTTASGGYSHAEGHMTTASNGACHAEGDRTTASGNYGSHAEGYSTTASGDFSHAEGIYTTASNNSSHAGGHYNVEMTTGGAFNNTKGTAFVIGNGVSDTALSNAFSVQFDGKVKAKSTITASTTADYAEFFEWLDGNPDDEDRVGYFVTLDGDKIRIATAADDYVLGVVSGEPFVLGNGDCDVWNGMFLRDEFRRTIFEPAPKMVEVDGEFVEVEGEFEGTRPKLNPEYDYTQKYISRFERKEWSPIGMLGVLAVRHDGTAVVNGYVTVNAEGIATVCEKSAENAYRVIKSNTDSVVEIIFR